MCQGGGGVVENKKQVKEGYRYAEPLSHFALSMAVRKFRTISN